MAGRFRYTADRIGRLTKCNIVSLMLSESERRTLMQSKHSGVNAL